MPVDNRTLETSPEPIDGMLMRRVDLQTSPNVAMMVRESLSSMPEVSNVNVDEENSMITFFINGNKGLANKVLRWVEQVVGNANIHCPTSPLSPEVEDSAIAKEKADEKEEKTKEEAKEEESKKEEIKEEEIEEEEKEEEKEEESKERKSSSRVRELDSPWRENSWSSQGSSFHINLKKCTHLHTWVEAALEEHYQSNTCASTAGEFYAAMERAKYLVEECSHKRWLLKAVELWECTEHFVEVLLDLCWSAYIMSLGVGNIESSEKWRSHVEELLNSRTKQNDMTRLFRDYNMVDKRDLNVMVEATLADENLVVDCPEHELGLLLRDRLRNTNLRQPQFLKKYRINIFNFIFPPKLSSKTGATGTIVIQPWVYAKQFAVKIRRPGQEHGEVTFKWEFDILDKYRSPYIVGVVGYWEVDVQLIWPFPPTVRNPFLLMEFLDYNLKDLIDKCKLWSRDQGLMREGFSELETINLMLPVARALRFVHGKDVAHRDVKPQNIMCKNVKLPNVIKEDVIVKLIDFGEAWESVSEIPDGEWGRAGTAGYMDPSMWKQKQDVVGYTLFMGDVFSFAMAFAELLTWRSPSEAFGVPYPQAAQIRLKEGKRPSLPHDLPHYLKFIVESCWDVDHMKRPDFKDICSMLQHAKVLLSEHNDFDCELEDIFLYEDANGFEQQLQRAPRAFRQYQTRPNPILYE